MWEGEWGRETVVMIHQKPLVILPNVTQFLEQQFPLTLCGISFGTTELPYIV